MSPYDITLVVRPRIATREVLLLPSDAVVAGGVVIVGTRAVVSVCMVMNPVTVVMERLETLEEVELELGIVVVLVEVLEDADDERLEVRLLEDILTGGTTVLNTVEKELALDRPIVALLDELEEDMGVVLIVVWLSNVEADCGGREPPMTVVVDEGRFELPLDTVETGAVIEDDIDDLELEMIMLELLGNGLGDPGLRDDATDVDPDVLGAVSGLVRGGVDAEGHVKMFELVEDDFVGSEVGALELVVLERATGEDAVTATAVVTTKVRVVDGSEIVRVLVVVETEAIVVVPVLSDAGVEGVELLKEE